MQYQDMRESPLFPLRRFLSPLFLFEKKEGFPPNRRAPLAGEAIPAGQAYSSCHTAGTVIK